MTKRKLLEKNYEMACHNLLCYSANYGMTEPKEGYEKEWLAAQEECQLLIEMINEYPDHQENFEFVGTISGWEGGFNKIKNENYIKSIIVQDKDGNKRLFNIDYQLGINILKNYDEERHERYDLNKNTDMVFTINNFSQMIIKWHWKLN